MLHNAYFVYPALAAVQKFMETFREFPPAQHPDSFTIDQAIEKMSAAAGGH
jgi:arylsulfatase